jgi:hypothetical protein
VCLIKQPRFRPCLSHLHEGLQLWLLSFFWNPVKSCRYLGIRVSLVPSLIKDHCPAPPRTVRWVRCRTCTATGYKLYQEGGQRQTAHQVPWEGLVLAGPGDWACHMAGVLTLCHTPVLKEVNRSFYMCAQDVQIKRMANTKVNSSQCYDYNSIRVYLLQNDTWVWKRLHSKQHHDVYSKCG